jgi:aquaporin Z
MAHPEGLIVANHLPAARQTTSSAPPAEHLIMDANFIDLKLYFAELAGTFVLVFAGCGSAVFDGSRIGPLGISLTFGLALLAMVYTLGPISGCHVNPAVTVGLLLSGKFRARQVPGYIAAQVIGGILACAVLFVIAQSRPGFSPAVTGFAANGYGVHSPGHYGLSAAFVTEAILTAFLVLTVLGSTDASASTDLAGVAIGLVLTVTNLVAIPVTNASINPARSVAPALFAGGWAIDQLWLFIVAPLCGGGLAAAAYRLLQMQPAAAQRSTAARLARQSIGG